MSPRAWRRVAIALLAALILLKLAWHAWLAPPLRFPLGFVLGLALIPLLIPALIACFDLRRGAFWAGFVALAYFSHGIMEAWTTPAVRLLAHLEWIIATLLIVAVGIAGLNERRDARARAAASGASGASASSA